MLVASGALQKRIESLGHAAKGSFNQSEYVMTAGHMLPLHRAWQICRIACANWKSA